VIAYRELVLLLNSADSPANVAAIADLIDSGLSAFTTDADAITGLTTTPAGNARLRAMTLPTAHS